MLLVLGVKTAIKMRNGSGTSELDEFFGREAERVGLWSRNIMTRLIDT